MENWLVVLFIFPYISWILFLHFIPERIAYFSLLFLRSVAFSLSAGGLTHRGGGHKTSQAEPTEREMEGKGERARAGASDFVTASKGKVFPGERENEGKEGEEERGR